MMNIKLKEKYVQCERLEYEIISARRDLDEKKKLCKHLEEETFSMKNSEKCNRSKETLKDNESSLKIPTK